METTRPPRHLCFRTKWLVGPDPTNQVAITQLTNILAEVAPKAGFLVPLHSHDLRRGAARDASNLSTPIKGVATPAVAASIGNSSTSLFRGSTATYVGSIAEDVWTRRVEENFNDPLDVDITDNVYVKRRMVRPSAITVMCEEEGLDSANPINRKKMSVKGRKQAIEDWVWAEKSSVMVTPATTHGNAGNCSQRLNVGANFGQGCLQNRHRAKSMPTKPQFPTSSSAKL